MGTVTGKKTWATTSAREVLLTTVVLLQLPGTEVKKLRSRKTANGSDAEVQISVRTNMPPMKNLPGTTPQSSPLVLISTRKTGMMTQPMPTNRLVRMVSPRTPPFGKLKCVSMQE